jgi:hypothetical protein
LILNNNDYTAQGIAAIALAVLFPIYWIAEIFSGTFDSGEAFYRNTLSLEFLDFVFLIIGLLCIYVYLNFKKILHEQFNFQGVDIFINVIIAITGIHFVGLFALDVFMTIFGDKVHLPAHKLAMNINYVVGIGSMIIFGAADLLMGVLLLKKPGADNGILKAFAIITIIQGIFEITIIFSGAVILIFPIALMILAMLFMRKLDVLEVI